MFSPRENDLWWQLDVSQFVCVRLTSKSARGKTNLFSKHCVICWIHWFLLPLEWKSTMFATCTAWRCLSTLGSRKKRERTLKTGWVWAEPWWDGPAGWLTQTPREFLVQQSGCGPFPGWALEVSSWMCSQRGLCGSPIVLILERIRLEAHPENCSLQNKKEKQCMFEPMVLDLERWV